MHSLSSLFSFKCECCCDQGGGHYGECGSADSSKGCDLYDATTKYIAGVSPTCKTDNPTYPDLAVYMNFLSGLKIKTPSLKSHFLRKDRHPEAI